MQRAINTMALAFYIRDKYNINVEYIHTPFSYEGFDEKFNLLEKEREFACKYPFGDPYNEVKREGYLKRAILWDENMCYSGLTINDINLNEFKIINVNELGKKRLFQDISNNSYNNKLYIIKYLQKEFNTGYFDIDMINTYYSNICEKFKIFDTDVNNDIILQIRRKDAIYHREARYLSDDYYLSILNELEQYRNKYNITVHTQRSNFDSNKYSYWDVIYDDEEQDYDLFKKMVNAKVLVVGKTSFSVAAAFLNKNIVVYPNQTARGLSRYINKEIFIKLLKNGIL